MATSPTKPGTLKLSEVARKVSAPTGISHTGWPKVLDCCTRKMGVGFDPWQDAAGRLILAERPDGKLAAMIDGVGLSLPRQVGKTYLIMSIVFALCILRPGLLVIWSAHHARTHQETFLAMQAFAARSKVAPYILQIFTGSGDEEIRFVNRSRILFGARERGFGRGIPGVDVLIADEAQIMTEKALDAHTRQPHPSVSRGALLTERSEVLRLLGRPEAARQAAEAAVAEEGGSGKAFMVRAGAYIDQRNFTAAGDDIDALQVLAETLSDVRLQAESFRLRGSLSQVAGRIDDARRELGQAVDLLRDTDEPAQLAHALRVRGFIEMFGGSLVDAEWFFGEADGLYATLGDERGLAYIEQHRAWIAFLSGDLAAARERLTHAAEAHERLAIATALVGRSVCWPSSSSSKGTSTVPRHWPAPWLKKPSYAATCGQPA